MRVGLYIIICLLVLVVLPMKNMSDMKSIGALHFLAAFRKSLSPYFSRKPSGSTNQLFKKIVNFIFGMNYRYIISQISAVFGPRWILNGIFSSERWTEQATIRCKLIARWLFSCIPMAGSSVWSLYSALPASLSTALLSRNALFLFTCYIAGL